MAAGDRRVVRLAGDPPLDFAAVEQDDGLFALATVILSTGGVEGAAPVFEASVPLTAAPLNKASASFTRPNNATQYAAQDEISDTTVAGSVTILNFANLVNEDAGSGYIIKAILRVTAIAATASTTNAVFRLLLFDTAPTPVGDNAAFPLLSADALKEVCYIDFAQITEGTGSTALYGLDDGVRTAFKCAAGARNLRGLLVAKAAYTPTAQSVWTIELMTEPASAA
jgi:hypothetical protein